MLHNNSNLKGVINMTTQPIRDKKHIKQISDYFLHKGEFRNLLMFVMGIHTALRISDMLRLTWGDVYDFSNNRVRGELTVIEQKTGKSKIIAVNPAVVNAVIRLFKHSSPMPGSFLFANPRQNKSISRVQAYRILRAAAEKAHIQARISCHSLRKTFGYHLWKTGASLVIIMDIYNHSSYTVTKRYLCVTQDEKNSAYLKMRLGA